jgi:hypothetical protein
MIKTIVRIQSATCLICLAFAVSAHGQARPGSVGQPVLSYIVDTAHQVRPMVGVVGAASIGNPVDLGFDVAQAAVPPSHDYILATPSVGGWPVLLQVSSGAMTPQWTAFSQGNIDPAVIFDRVTLSPTGSSAAFFSSAQSRIYVFKNLTKTSVAYSQIDVNGLGTITAFGVSDDGQKVAIGVSDGQNGALYVSNYGQPPFPAATMPHPAVIAFLRNSGNSAVADDQQNTVYLIADNQAFPIASASDGIAGPVAIATSNDNQRVFVANSQTGTVMTISLGGIATAPVYCNCNLTGLYPTNADSVFRLTDFSGSPVLLFDANSAAPRITFVPASGSQF